MGYCETLNTSDAQHLFSNPSKVLKNFSNLIFIHKKRRKNDTNILIELEKSCVNGYPITNTSIREELHNYQFRTMGLPTNRGYKCRIIGMNGTTIGKVKNGFTFN